MTHRTFVLRITGSQSGIVAQVVSSPEGQSRAVPLDLPLTGEDLARVARAVAAGAPRKGLRHLLGLGLDSDLDAGLGSGRRDPSRDLLPVARRLSEALFRGPVADRLSRALGRADGSEGSSLRIALRIDPELPEAERFQDLPWELLTAPGASRPLALSRRTPVVRYLEVGQPGELPPLPETLRILVVAPAPAGTPPLDLSGELADLRRAWRGADEVEIEVVEPPTLEALLAALGRGPVHALHFMGHGGSCRPDERGRSGRRGVGELLFEGADGEADPVDAGLLAEQLADFTSTLRLVVLNACESARGARGPRGDEGAFRAAPDRFMESAGVAAALVETGVPAVVAMQHPIDDRAALVLSRALYTSIARGKPIDVAVTEARLAICRHRRGSAEWLTPALFLRSDDGRIFAPPERSGLAAERRARRRWRAARRVGLAVGLAGVLVASGAVIEQRLDRPGHLEHLEQAATESPGTVEARTDDLVDNPADKPAGSSDRTIQPLVTVDDGARESGQEPRHAERSPPPEPPSVSSPLRTIAAGGHLDLDGDLTGELDGDLSEDWAGGAVGPVTVSVDFLRVAGEEVARLTVATADGTLETKAAVGPTVFEVRAARRTLRVQVTNVDFSERTVTLRVLSP